MYIFYLAEKSLINSLNLVYLIINTQNKSHINFKLNKVGYINFLMINVSAPIHC